ncbi:MAG: hypothetical protein P4L46_23965 [Fimbriimonas sp.]|nr:hypothetical protein [Fimbriimonas sp.]
MLHVGMTCMCPHAGQVQAVASNPRVTLGGQPAVTLSDTFTVSGCPFQIPIGTGTKPQPCVKVQWLVPAMRVKIGGNPVLVTSSTGICQSAEQIPQGSPVISVTQMKVSAQ